jgi:hypothetical protein
MNAAFSITPQTLEPHAHELAHLASIQLYILHGFSLSFIAKKNANITTEKENVTWRINPSLVKSYKFKHDS